MPLPPHSIYLLCSAAHPLPRHFLGYKIGTITEPALYVVVESMTKKKKKQRRQQRRTAQDSLLRRARNKHPCSLFAMLAQSSEVLVSCYSVNAPSSAGPNVQHFHMTRICLSFKSDGALCPAGRRG